MPKLLTELEILCAGKPPGEQRLTRIVYRIRKCEPLADDDLAFIAAAFGRILDGGDLRKALDIAGKPGQGAPKLSALKVEKRAQRTLAVEIHCAHGLSRAEAIRRVAADFHKTENAITKDCARDRELVQQMLSAARFFGVDVTKLEAPTGKDGRKTGG